MPTVAELGNDHKVQWCPGCVLPGSLIQKNPSVEKIENIEVGDRVLGSDGRYHKVTEVFVHKHEGKMYRINAKCLGQTTLTEEHPVLAVERKHAKLHNTEFELVWTRADKLKKGDYLAFPIMKEETDLDEIELPIFKKEMDRKSKPLPKKIKLSEDFLLLCGYYIAEGNVYKREIIFTFNISEKQFVEDVISATQKIFGLSPTLRTRENKNICEVTINSSPLARLFEEWFGTGAANKKIPHFMMLLPKEKQKALVKGMWRGDGWVGKGRANYKTISRLLAEQLKILLVRHCIVPTMSINKAYGIHKEAYSIQIVSRRDIQLLSGLLDIEPRLRQEGKPPSSILLTDFALVPIRKIEIFEYNGPVHNLEVEGIHSYVSETATLHNCGDFGILLALKNALVELGRDPKDVVVVSGIGCSGKLPHYIKTYGFEGLHGRALPVASGVKLANHGLTVVTVGGDGDGYGIGMGHFIHSLRRNIDITYIVHNNQIYGLTTGQYSPTSHKGTISSSSPYGSLEEPVNPLTLALSSGCGFVSRGFAGDIKHLTQLIVSAIKYRGFSLVDVLQPCVTFNKLNTFAWFMQRVKKLEQENHNPADFSAALNQALQWGDRIPIGVFYNVPRPLYEDGLPQLASPLVKQPLTVDYEKLLNPFE